MIANELMAVLPIVMILGFIVSAPIIFYAAYKALNLVGLVNNAKTDNGYTRGR